MNPVYVSIGSNIERERHIVQALEALAVRFGALQLSSVYESESVGFDGDPFYNLVARFETNLSVGELAQCLRDIEAANGRSRVGAKFSSRTLDIDILTYGEQVGDCDGINLPRPEILQNAFVLLPLAELAADVRHPQLGQRYTELWQRYDRDQKLWPVDFIWRGRAISRAQAAGA